MAEQTATISSWGDLAAAVGRWVRQHLPRAIVMSAISAAFGYAVNFFVMAFRWDGFRAPTGESDVITAENSLLAGSLFWTAISAFGFAVFAYGRRVGWDQVREELLALPTTVREMLTGDERNRSVTGLAWSAALSLLIAVVVSPAVAGVTAAFLVVFATTPLGSLVTNLLRRLWIAVIHQFAPGKGKPSSAVGSAAVTAAGTAAGVLVAMAVDNTFLQIAALIGAVAVAYIAANEDAAPPAGTTVVLLALAALAVRELFDVAVAVADDGGWGEYCAFNPDCNVIDYVNSEGATEVLTRAGAGGAGAAVGAPVGAAVGDILATAGGDGGAGGSDPDGEPDGEGDGTGPDDTAREGTEGTDGVPPRPDTAPPTDGPPQTDTGAPTDAPPVPTGEGGEGATTDAGEGATGDAGEGATADAGTGASTESGAEGVQPDGSIPPRPDMPPPMPSEPPPMPGDVTETATDTDSVPPTVRTDDVPDIGEVTGGAAAGATAGGERDPDDAAAAAAAGDAAAAAAAAGHVAASGAAAAGGGRPPGLSDEEIVYPDGTTRADRLDQLRRDQEAAEDANSWWGWIRGTAADTVAGIGDELVNKLPGQVMDAAEAGLEMASDAVDAVTDPNNVQMVLEGTAETVYDAGRLLLPPGLVDTSDVEADLAAGLEAAKDAVETAGTVAGTLYAAAENDPAGAARVVAETVINKDNWDKALDPDVPVLQRIGRAVWGAVDGVSTLGGIGAGGLRAVDKAGDLLRGARAADAAGDAARAGSVLDDLGRAAAAGVDGTTDVARAADATADAARAADAASDTARVADTASDAGRAADTASDAGRAADTASDAGRAADTAADAGRATDAATGAGRAADATADTARAADATADTARAADATTDAATGAARAADATADTARAADATADTARAADATADTARAADATADATRAADATADATTTARAADSASDTARAADATTDATRAADTTSDAARAADAADDTSDAARLRRQQQRSTAPLDKDGIPIVDTGADYVRNLPENAIIDANRITDTGYTGSQLYGRGELIEDVAHDGSTFMRRSEMGMRDLARKHGVTAETRTTNFDSMRHIRDGNAVPKPLDIKSKTIKDVDTYLGARKGDEGLVGFFEPKKPNPNLPDFDGPEGQKLYAEVMERYQKRSDEFNDLRGKIQKLEDKGVARWDKDRGIVVDANTGKPYAGDIDPVVFRDANTGQPVSRERYEQIMRDFTDPRNAIGGQHGAEVEVVRDLTRGLTPGTPEYNQAVNEAYELHQKLSQAQHTEVTVKMGTDGVLRRSQHYGGQLPLSSNAGIDSVLGR